MKVKCIDAGSGTLLTKSKIYEVMEESKDCYKLIDNTIEKGNYLKTRFEIVKDNEDMKLSDLKTGMVVKYREGYEYIVFKDAVFKNCLIGKEEYNFLNHHNEDLTNKIFKEHDIVKVYSPNEVELKLYLGGKKKLSDFKPIWERKDNSKEVAALKTDITNIENTLKEMKDKLNRLESEV